MSLLSTTMIVMISSLILSTAAKSLCVAFEPNEDDDDAEDLDDYKSSVAVGAEVVVVAVVVVVLICGCGCCW